MTLWEGRLGGGTADEVMAYTVSLAFDRRLAVDDLAASRAHVRGLGRAGILEASEVSILVAALERVEVEILGGAFEFRAEDEDIHTAVERRVTEIAGDVGAKLHTGRSRNDQVATDLRLYTRRALLRVAGRVVGLQEVLERRAVEAGDAYLPGYTHLQRAQPVLLAHHLLAHGWALARDVDRLLHSVVRTDVSPLGAGALAGSSLPLDPDWVAEELGFSGRFENSLDAVSDRDFVAEALFDLALLGVHLSRLGEELVLWSTEEFGFLVVADAYATGSSMLPQKKNPDVAELARGKTGRLVGHLVGLLTTLKGLPLAYNRDLQEDKEPLFDAVDQIEPGLQAMAGMLEHSRFDLDRMRSAADGPTTAAVDLAEWMVERGMPFRQAHGVVGGLVRDSVERGVPLAELVQSHPSLGTEALVLLEPGVAVTRRTTP
ncbi:MAG: argininosuccinate lyase, partial [Acidobacteriota bacterium]|nr:argininosuccinate lyase [Acidobacteriota bacterium]